MCRLLLTSQTTARSPRLSICRVYTKWARRANVRRARQVAARLGPRLSPTEYRVHALERGRLKQALIAVGWPAEDLAGFVEGAPLRIALRRATPDGRPFQLRDYQLAAADAFWVAGGIGGGSGVLVLPCGAGKTLIGIEVLRRASMHTLVLTTSIVASRQWRDELLARTDLEAGEVGEYSGERKSVRPVTIATYQVLTHRRRASPRTTSRRHIRTWR
jgi:DNA excision repair protein ERCC-3